MDVFNRIINMSIYVGILFVMFGCFRECSGHGRLLEPPGRSSMWRYPDDFPSAPNNYNDNELNCGGRSYQHESVGGKCGVCGDKFIPGSTVPRPNEVGGLYANGVITRQYKRNDVITVTIEVTAEHKGYFEFRICPVNDKSKAATHDCLDANLLKLADGSERFDYGSIVGRHYPKVQLPRDLTCSQCVFQWRWRTGNSWGYDASGGCLGCGKQEEFYGCSDISIVDDTTHQSTQNPTDAPTTSKKQTTLGHVTNEATTAGHVTSSRRFEAVGVWKNNSGMHDWCNVNCAAGYCPNSHCRRIGSNPGASTPRCKAIGAWYGNADMDAWCQTNCDLNNCPKTNCICN